MGKWSIEARAHAAARRASTRPTKEAAHPYGSAFRAMREGRGLTLDEAAKRAGVARSQIEFYETGAREPTLTTAKKIARAYGCTLDELTRQPAQ
jgi:transcriptional regulator with XRE-family HTH domain